MDVDEHKDELTSRPPTLEDLLGVCEALNSAGARYLVLGGMALIEHGLARATCDVDLLVDDDPLNVERVRQALTCLPDKASLEVRPTDPRDYVVVRINDEITVDIMAKACGLSFAESVAMIEWRVVRGVRIPFASLKLLWKTKQTHREKDALDRAFLAEQLAARGERLEE